MTEVIISIPNDIAKSYSLSDWQAMLRLNTAIELYRQGRFSTKVATRFSGVANEIVFLLECQNRGIARQTYNSIEELNHEVANINQLMALKNV